MQKMIVWVGIVAVLGIATYALLPSGDSVGKDDMQKEDVMTEGEKQEKQIDDKSIPAGGSMIKDESMMDAGEGMMEKGSYEAYAPEKLALAEKGKIVLYFHADWCPICRGLEAEIQSNASAIPPGVHILKVDYDTATSLKQKYGVTYQHTFVQVNAEGMQLAKWGDATTLAQVLARVK